MKALGLALMGGLLIVAGGYWWSSRPAETLSFENPRDFALAPLPETSEAKADSRSNESATTPGVPSDQVPPADLSPGVPSATPPALEIHDRQVNFGFRVPPTPRSIDTLVFHSAYFTGQGQVFDLELLLRQYEALGTTPHYLIDREGKIIQLVRESHIAYHVGQSKLPDGRTNGNDVSIGIELMGTEESGFTEKQYASLNRLVADIKTRWSIRNMVAHSDISTAPERKTDPWKFDWKQVK